MRSNGTDEALNKLDFVIAAPRLRGDKLRGNDVEFP
jgi:hypothetical protein